MVASFAVVRAVSTRRGPRALPVLRSCLRGLRERRRRQRAAPPLRHAVALMPKWARNARANVAADMKPWSSAISSTLASVRPISADPARSRRSRWMKPKSVSPVTALKTRSKWKGENAATRASSASVSPSARCPRMWSMTRLTRRSYSSRSAPPTAARSVLVGDRQLVGREQRDDLGPARGDDHFLLDARGRGAVGGGAVRLDREHHAGLQLHGIVERVQPADDGPLVQPQADAVAEVQPERGHLALEADLLRLGEGPRDLVRRHAGLDERDGLVHPLARLLVGHQLRLRRLADAERAVVAGAIADERHDDVEERLVAGPDDAVGEVVRVRAAALAGDRVDGLDVVAAHLVEALVGQGHDLVLARPRLERLEDVLVDAVHHRRRHVQEGQLVLTLEHARLEHHLLPVADLH